MELKLLKFSAQWCGPCKMQKTELENNPIGIDIQEIDIDSTTPEDMELVKRYKVMSIPNMVIIDNKGIVQARFTGYTTSGQIKQAIADLEEKGNERFVIIEDFNGIISLVSDPETGETLVFKTLDKASEEAKNWQNGKVVKL